MVHFKTKIKVAVQNFLGVKIIRNHLFSKYLEDQFWKWSYTIINIIIVERISIII